MKNGNILFLILIAVALFAALSYAVTSTSRTSGNGLNEAAQMKAIKLIQLGDSIKQVMNKHTLFSSCNYAAIDKNDAFGNPATNPHKCNVFDPANGTYTPYDADLISGVGDIYTKETDNLPFPNKRIDFLNSMRVVGIAVPDEKELIMYAFNIDDEICAAINKIANIDNGVMEEQSPYEGGYANPVGAPATSPTLTIADAATNLEGRLFGCYKASRTGTLTTSHFYYVLLER